MYSIPACPAAQQPWRAGCHGHLAKFWSFVLVKAALEGLTDRQPNRQVASEGGAQHMAVELGLHQPNGGIRKRNVVGFGHQSGGISDQEGGEVTDLGTVEQGLIIDINEQGSGEGLVLTLQHRLNGGLHRFSLRVDHRQGLEPSTVAENQP